MAEKAVSAKWEPTLLIFGIFDALQIQGVLAIHDFWCKANCRKLQNREKQGQFWYQNSKMSKNISKVQFFSNFFNLQLRDT